MKFPLHNSCFEGIVNFELLDYKNHYDINETHRHNYFEMIFFDNGGGEQIIDFEKESIKSKQISFIYPGQIHSLKRSEKTSGIVVQFHPDKLKNLNSLFIKVCQTKTNIILSTSKFEYLFSLVDFLKKRQKQQKLFESQLAEHSISLILYEIMEAMKYKKASINNDLTFQFLNLLEREFENNKLVKNYSSELRVSSRKLNETLLKHLGKKTLELLHERQILEVKRLLLQDDLTLKEIAYKLNFDSPATFTRFVKKQTGLLPSELKLYVDKIHNF